MNQKSDIAKIDLALIANQGNGATALKRCQDISQQFEYSFKHWGSLDAFLQSEAQPRVVVAYSAEAANKEAAAEFAQVIRFRVKDAYVVCVVSNRLGKEVAAFVKKSGASLILLEEELYHTSKLEYSCTQLVKAEYMPIKWADLVPDKPVGFDIYHLMPMRQKFIQFAFEGDVLNAEKVKKLSDVGEIYLRKKDAEKFSQYSAANVDRSASGLARRCRSQFLALYASYSQMVLLLTDQSEMASYQEGEELLKKCKNLAGELMITLGEFGDAWEIVNNSTIGEFGSTERAPAVAAYAAFFGLQLGMNNIEEIMIAALLSELGLLLLPPAISNKIRIGQMDKFSDEERQVYEQYPNRSLEIILQRKLPVEEKLRELLVSTHERADGTGFPRHLPARKISDHAQLIHFCREFDRRTLIKMGAARTKREDMRKKIIQEELDKPSRFSPAFMQKLKILFQNQK